ncbi:hypothetical protein BD408DRAFT_411147 [Parasitella parasitica]|nr:hypothetical protein BD408DRAFT_411147 [Parasitella parasitica]
MSIVSAGLTEETNAKTYIKNLEIRLEDSATREHRLEALLERNEVQQNAVKELNISRQEKIKLESDLDAMKEAKNLIKAALKTSLETNRRLQRQEEDCEKRMSDLQRSLTAIRENASKEIQEVKQNWIEENRSLRETNCDRNLVNLLFSIFLLEKHCVSSVQVKIMIWV